MRNALADAGSRLREGDAPQEALGRYVEPRGRFGLGRSPRIVREASAWRLGALLLRPDGAVAGVGEVVRAAEPGRRGYTAESARRRAELRAAARRGGFAEGEVVHIGWSAIDLDAVDRGEASGPLSVAEGVPLVRWSAAGGLMPLERYLAERVELLLQPPQGA